MTIAWIYPRSSRCGISFYAQKYIAALRPLVDIVEVDPRDILLSRAAAAAAINACAAAHLQYETALYLDGSRDFFPALCAAARVPLIVSLHEVYRRFPGVYPREEIRGFPPLAALRRLIYDLRHPAPRARARHERAAFYARSLAVHAQWQRQILIDKGIRGDMIRVIPYPLGPAPAAAPPPCIAGGPLRLGSLGFLNANYGYGLLVDALALLQRPWTFVWIGGLRREEDRPLLGRIEEEVRSRGWAERFRITGWVDDSERDRLLDGIGVYCALFAARSSSESLATAMSSLRPIVATRLPLTEELNAPAERMAVVDAKAADVAAAIERLADDNAYRQLLSANLRSYAEKNSFAAMARQLMDLYTGLIGPSG